MAENDYKKSRKRVINPYTFVPINRKKKETKDAENVYKKKSELHTGVLHCSMYLKTPLAIPDTENGKEEYVKGGGKESVHMTYPFTRRGDCYMISGSSIRGVLRSLYETMTESCFATLKENTGLSRRVDSRSAYKPGILKKENGKYVLYQAKRYVVMVDQYKEVYEHSDHRYPIAIRDGERRILDINGNGLKTGDEVCFDWENSQHKKNNRTIWGDGGVVTALYGSEDPDGGNSMSKGILFVGEHINKKHGESVFEITEKVDGLCHETLKKAYDKFWETLYYYRNTSINRKLTEGKPEQRHSGYLGYHEDMTEAAGIPLWYNVVDVGEKTKLVNFSPAAIGRTMYNRSLNELVGKQNTCKNRNNLCEACLLFGMISEKNGKAMGSRVRILDALSEGKFQSRYVTLRELGTPRNSYLPFYALARGKEAASSYDDNEVEIAGRKYYWHNKKVLETDGAKAYREESRNGFEKTKRNSTMELLMPDENAKFSFDIYYDCITEEQKEKLLWTVCLGENRKDSSICHKIGRGKPFGLGSIKIVIDSNQEREISADNYLLKTIAVKNPVLPESDVMKHLKKVLNMEEPYVDNGGYEIDYPDVLDKDGKSIEQKIKSKDNNVARHKWYSFNKNQLLRISSKSQTIENITYQGTIKSGNESYSGGSRSSEYRKDGTHSQRRDNQKEGSGHDSYNHDPQKDNVSKQNVGSNRSVERFANTPFADLKLDDLDKGASRKFNKKNKFN